MNTAMVLDNLNLDTFTRKEVYEAIRSINANASDAQVRYCLSSMLSSGKIVRCGRNDYAKKSDSVLPLYTNHYSEEAQALIQCMENKYPVLDYRIWELNWMNEFVNHLIGKNMIFLEVEKDACEFVYSDISREVKERVLLKPSEKELMMYSNNNTVIINRLITEAPKGEPGKYNVPLEKIIVDLLANKNLMISKGDYPDAVRAMFAKYQIDKPKLYRYARRRSKEEEVKCFLQKISQ